MNEPHEIPIPLPTKRRPIPDQIKAYDNRDDRLEITRLLRHLTPMRRLAFFRWACAQAVFPGTEHGHPEVASSTVKLAREARHCDAADERLTVDIVMSLSHMWIDYSLDASVCLARLVAMVRGRD